MVGTSTLRKSSDIEQYEVNYKYITIIVVCR